MPPKKPDRAHSKSPVPKTVDADSAAALQQLALPEGTKVNAGYIPVPPAFNRRVREKVTCPQIGLNRFVLVDRSVIGMDDPVYRKSREVWEVVPRGQARVFPLSASVDGIPLCSIAGLRKFGYREDTYGEMANVQSVVGIEKENGECAHIAGFSYKGEKFWFVGSKHVHLLFRVGVPKDLDVFENVQRFRYSLRIARLWNSMCRKKGDTWSERVHAFISGRQFTLDAEAIFSDSQHIVDYQASNELRFFAVSVDGPSAKGLSLPPEEALALFKSLDLPSAQQSPRMAMGSEEFTQFLAQVARRNNSEGVVVYGSDATGRVCCLWKEKSYPYVMERVAREAIKKGTVGKMLLAYLQRRLSQQPADLRLHFADWEKERLPFLIDFAAWLHYSKKFTADDPWAMSTQWLSLQRECKAATPETIQAARDFIQGIVLPATVTMQVIMMVGPPGSGKSTMARILHTLLVQAGRSPHWLNQDEAGSRQFYLNSIKDAMAKDAKITHLILDKVNLNVLNRADYTELGVDPNVTVVFSHPDGEEEFKKVCVQRVVDRGEQHRTLRVSANSGNEEKDKVTNLVDDMVESYVPVEDTPGLVTLNVEAPLDENVSKVWARMCELSTTEELPSLASLSLEKALGVNREYEKLLESMPRPRFAGIGVVDPAAFVSTLAAQLPSPGVLNSKKVQAAFHVTTKFFGGTVDPSFLVEAARLQGQSITLKCEYVVFDNKGVAVAVKGGDRDFICTNAIPHITVAIAEGVRPVYSNELLQLALKGDPSVKRVDLDFTVQGVFKIEF